MLVLVRYRTRAIIQYGTSTRTVDPSPRPGGLPRLSCCYLQDLEELLLVRTNPAPEHRGPKTLQTEPRTPDAPQAPARPRPTRTQGPPLPGPPLPACRVPGSVLCGIVCLWSGALVVEVPSTTREPSFSDGMRSGFVRYEFSMHSRFVRYAFGIRSGCLPSCLLPPCMRVGRTVLYCTTVHVDTVDLIFGRHAFGICCDAAAMRRSHIQSL